MLERRNIWVRVAAIACVACLVLCATGCRDSDALKEIVYDQTSEVIDYSNSSKIYINDSTADIESEEVSALETSDEASVYSDQVQNLVVYSSTPNTEGYTAKKSIFAYPSDFNGIEASEDVCFVSSDNETAYDHPPTVEDEQEDELDEEQEPDQVAENSVETDAPVTTSGPATGEGESKEEEKEEQTESENEQNPEDPGEGEKPQPGEDEDGSGTGGDLQQGGDASDPTQPPEPASKVAAYGAAATLVQMIGGKGALAATDKTTLDSSFSTVFSESAATIKKGWKDDGATAAKMDIDAIIESGAETILVYQSDYLSNSLSKAEAKKLDKAGITKTILLPMTNSQYIKDDALLIGDLLAEATSDQIQYAGQTAARAADYVKFHNEVVKAAADANGGLAGSKVFQGGSDTAAPSLDPATPTYTCVLDKYEDAVYQGKGRDDWKPATGLAFASAGYGTTPMSFYIQAGGLANTAAERTNVNSGGALVAWQFNTNTFPYKATDWKGSTAKSAVMPDGLSLLTTDIDKQDIYPIGKSFGSSVFPKAIVTDKSIKSSIIANSRLAAGAYHPYGFAESKNIKLLGPLADTPSCIGSMGSEGQKANLFSKGYIDDANIVVSPTGMFSDWTAGTAESFLVAGWVNDVAKDNKDKISTSAGTGWWNQVKYFYSTFYGYDVSGNRSAMDPQGEDDPADLEEADASGDASESSGSNGASGSSSSKSSSGSGGSSSSSSSSSSTPAKDSSSSGSSSGAGGSGDSVSSGGSSTPSGSASSSSASKDGD